jgi:hypothetical protein
MAEQFQTSFIPKRVVETPTKGEVSGAGITFVVGLGVLIVSLLLAGGVFGYGQYLKGSIENKKNQLQLQKDAFQPELIRAMARLSDKMKIGQQLLKDHIAASEIFALLQQDTLQTVRFSSFAFSHTQDGSVKISLQGQGLSFTSVALQADAFSQERFLKDTLFSGFALDPVGNISFSVAATVDPAVVSYENLVHQGGTARVETEPAPIADTSAPEPSTADVPVAAHEGGVQVGG